VDQEVAKTLGELELKLQALERELTSIGGPDTQAQPKTPGTLIDEAVEREGDSNQHANAVPRATPEEAAQATLREDAALEGDGFGGPAVFGGEEVPAQAGATVERDWTVEIRETAYGEIPTPPAPPSPPPSPAPPGPSPDPAPAPPPPPMTPPGPPPPTTPPGTAPEPDMHQSSTPPPGLVQPTIPAGVTPPSSPRAWPPPPDPRRSAAVEESRAVDLAELVRFRDKLARTMDDLIDEYSKLLPAEPLPPRRPQR
jgi:hypothetical protein